MNIVTLIGHLGAEPEATIGESQKTRCRMSLATNKTWNNNGEKKERTDWHRIVAFGPLADVCMQYLGTGSHIAVSGELRTSNWEDEHGQKRVSVEIVARSIEFLDKRPPVEQAEDDDEIPF